MGNYNTLRVLRSTSVGLFLGDDEGTEVLLPNKYVPETFEIDGELTIFCYLDHQERPIATTQTPLVTRDHFAFLRVVDISSHGAFLDWGLEKHLFVPFAEQTVKMQKDKSYLVRCYLDEETFRLAASSRIDNFLSNEVIDLKANDEVELIISRKTELGWEAIIDHRHKGLLFFSDVFKSIRVGDKLKGFIKTIRPDNKIDLALRPQGREALEPAAEVVFDRLKASKGYLPLHDKSAPEEIRETLEMSKKTFKKAIGVLYKAKKLEIKDDGIYLM